MAHITKVLEVFEVAEETILITIEKPEGYEFNAGQYITLGLPKNSGAKNKGEYIHAFSICNVPSDDFIQIITRVRDSKYKQTLAGMSEGDDIEISDPKGHIALPKDDSKGLVFLAGGVGITPIRSLMLGALEREYKGELHLFYSNKSPLTTPLFDEFYHLTEHDHGIDVTMNMTKDSMDTPNAVEGRITKEQIQEKLKDMGNRQYYIAGSDGFVEAIVGILVDLGVSKKDIVQESFPGY